MNLSSGARLGPYQVISRIGAGGMGEVWRARDTRLDRDVAIKVLPDAFAASPQLRLRFEREAKIISQLNHPHICTLHDVGEDYLVMELLEGESLAELLHRGPLPLPDVVRYGAQIAEALDRAHRAGVVHRDLKPANVMITRSGAKLLDFGLARNETSILGPQASGMETHHKPLTAEGTIVGTFQYMSPEQLEGVEIDPRSDIFALGVLLYEMATGQRAFEGATKTSLIAAIVRGEPRPLRELQPMTPPALEHVIRKCLEKTPDRRWQSAHDIAEELKWIGEMGSSAGAAAPLVAKQRNLERAAWLAGAILVAAIAAFAAWRLGYREPRPIALSIVPPDNVSMLTWLAASGSLTISPDGRWVTFAGVGPSRRPALYLRAIDSLEVRELPGTSGDELFPFWSADSRFIGFFAGRKLKKIDLVGSPPVVICDAPKGRSGDWNRDGTIIFSPDAVLPIHKVAATGGKPVPVTTFDASRQETTHRWATFLPDGRHFLYMAGTHISDRNAEGNAVFIASLDGGSPKLLLRARSNVSYSDGHLIYVRDEALLAHPFDAKRREFTGDPFPIAPRVLYSPSFFRAAFSVSRDGTIVYRAGVGDANSVMLWLDRSGKEIARLGEGGAIRDASISPDGQRIAVAIDDDSGMSDIWIHERSRNIRTRLTFGSGAEYGAVWSPDGKTIAYSDERRGVNEDVYMKKITGGATEERLIAADQPNEHYAPTSWSPDGRFILATHSAPAGPPQVVMIAAAGGKPEPLIPSPSSRAAFSPDGRWVAYRSAQSGRPEVYITSFPRPAGKWQVTSSGAEAFAWRGGEILYATADRELFAVSVDVNGSEPVIGTPSPLFSAPEMYHADVTADGRHFVAVSAPPEAKNSSISVVTNWRK